MSDQFPRGAWIELMTADGKSLCLDVQGLYRVEEIDEERTLLGMVVPGSGDVVEHEVQGSYADVLGRLVAFDIGSKGVP